MSSTIERAAERLGSMPPEAGIDAPVERSEPVAETVQDNSGSVVGRHSRFVDVDLARLAELGFATPDSRSSDIARDIRRIKRQLLLRVKRLTVESSELPPNLIMVTSALPGEGKTFIAVNLAMSLAAEHDFSALLIDGDLARGDVAQVMGIDGSCGLIDVLEDRGVVLDGHIAATNVEHLEVLTAGEPRLHADETWGSDATRRLFHDLAREDPNRLIIVDGPPLIATTEAAVMAHLMGQVIVVVEADRTPQAAVAEGLAHLEACPNVAVVLNKTSEGAGRGYGKGYGYGYGYGYGAEEREGG